jgi:hypothetical protein
LKKSDNFNNRKRSSAAASYSLSKPALNVAPDAALQLV